MTLEEVLKQDTGRKSLGALINMLDPNSPTYIDDVTAVRSHHEGETGVPMEEDEIGLQTQEFAEEMFPGIVKSLKELGDEDSEIEIIEEAEGEGEDIEDEEEVSVEEKEGNSKEEINLKEHLEKELTSEE